MTKGWRYGGLPSKIRLLHCNNYWVGRVPKTLVKLHQALIGSKLTYIAPNSQRHSDRPVVEGGQKQADHPKTPEASKTTTIQNHPKQVCWCVLHHVAPDSPVVKVPDLRATTSEPQPLGQLGYRLLSRLPVRVLAVLARPWSPRSLQSRLAAQCLPCLALESPVEVPSDEIGYQII